MNENQQDNSAKPIVTASITGEKTCNTEAPLQVPSASAESRNTTLRQVATRAEIPYGTAAEFFNGREVPDEARRRLESAASELGYTPLQVRAPDGGTCNALQPELCNPCEECGELMPMASYERWLARSNGDTIVRPDRRYCSNACRQRAYRKRSKSASQVA
jgi:hypothetical protein